MKHVASVVKDGAALYALVDEETGEITQFAQVLVPEDWSLHESAVLGTNLIEVLGLNGQAGKPGAPLSKALPKPPKPTVGLQLELGTPEVTHSEPEATVSEPVAARPKGARGRPGVGRPPTSGKFVNPDLHVQFYIPPDDVFATIVKHKGDGLTARQVGAELWSKFGKEGDAPKWVVRTVENRLNQAIADAKNKDAEDQLPFRWAYVPRVGRDGQPTKLESKVYLPR